MPRTRNTITIARPIEDVFAVLTDVERTGTWFPWDVAEHWTSPPPHGLGSTRHAVARMFGRRSENDAVVTEYDPPHRAAILGTSSNAPVLGELDFVRTGDGTTVTVTTDIMLRGAGRLVAPVVSWFYGRAWSRGLANLTQLMEAGKM